MIQDIQQYYDGKITLTQEYSADIKAAADDITRVKSSVGQFIDSSHITDVIKKRHETLSQLDDLLSTVKAPLEIPDTILLVDEG